MGLLLQAVDAAGPWTWRWLLTEEDTGEPLADHQVDLDPASDEVAAFGDLYGYARSHAAPDRRTVSETGRRWEPVIAAIAAARHGDQDAAAQLLPLLDEVAQDQDWAMLAGVLRRIVGGERGERVLEGLDPVDSAIIRETLSRIGRGHPQRS